MSSSSHPIVATGIHFRYELDASLPPVLDEVSLSVAAGEWVLLSGPSGSGKTTLLSLVGGLRSMQAGELTVLGQSLQAKDEAGLTALRRQIGFIFQDHHLFDVLSARETLQLTMQLHAERYTSKDFAQRPIAMLETVGLASRMDALPSQLSTGQRQRVAVARALINDPVIILADEPTASLDPASSSITLECLDAAKKRGAAILMISHDERHHVLVDRVLRMRDGRIVTASPSPPLLPASY
jgi:putative ABC transport system ATP-binding protein